MDSSMFGTSIKDLQGNFGTATHDNLQPISSGIGGIMGSGMGGNMGESMGGNMGGSMGGSMGGCPGVTLGGGIPPGGLPHNAKVPNVQYNPNHFGNYTQPVYNSPVGGCQDGTTINPSDIEELTKDLNQNLNRSSGNDSCKKNDKKDNKSFISINYVPDIIKDGIIIFVLFLILSQEISKSQIAKFLPQINPPEGEVGMYGIVSYGLIFSLLFMIFKLIVSKLS